jgi:hypothetical protein
LKTRFHEHVEIRLYKRRPSDEPSCRDRVAESRDKMSRRPMASRCRPLRMTRPAIRVFISRRLSERAISNAGVVVTRLADLGGAHGYSQPGRITILESLTPADTAAVLVHEFAHLCSAVAYVQSGRRGSVPVGPSGGQFPRVVVQTG